MLNEHWKTDNGRFKGLFTIDPTLAKSDTIATGINSFAYWDKVDQIIQAYTKIHPQEVADCLDQVRLERENSFTDFSEMINHEGKTGEQEFHNHAKIPLGLLKVLEKTNPEIFEDKLYYRKFLQKFPGFSASRRI